MAYFHDTSSATLIHINQINELWQTTDDAESCFAFEQVWKFILDPRWVIYTAAKDGILIYDTLNT